LRPQKQIELHGVVFDGWLPCIRVLSRDEVARLQPLAGRPAPAH
jgi:arginine decarboxylase